MLQRRVLFVLTIVFAIIALGVTWWILRRNQAQVQTQQEPEVKKVSVLVAARDLPKGIRISDADVRFADLPENQVPKDAAMEVETIKNSILRQDISKDSPIRLSSLIPPPEQLREFSVPIGLRGFVLYQPFTEGAADILLPGDLVDVVAIRRVGEVALAEVVVSRAQVLMAQDYAPGMTREERMRQRILSEAEQRTPAPPEPQQQAQTEGERRATPTMRQIVLAVTPEESVRLARAIEEGRALTVLRNERDYFLTPPIRSPKRLLEPEGQRPEAQRPEPPRATPQPVVQPAMAVQPVKPVRTVVIYRGTQKEEVIVNR